MYLSRHSYNEPLKNRVCKADAGAFTGEENRGAAFLTHLDMLCMFSLSAWRQNGDNAPGTPIWLTQIA